MTSSKGGIYSVLCLICLERTCCFFCGIFCHRKTFLLQRLNRRNIPYSIYNIVSNVLSTQHNIFVILIIHCIIIYQVDKTILVFLLFIILRIKTILVFLLFIILSCMSSVSKQLLNHLNMLCCILK